MLGSTNGIMPILVDPHHMITQLVSLALLFTGLTKSFRARPTARQGAIPAMCLNKKVLFGLGGVAVGLFLLRPSWGLTALPFLAAAICPLSMIFMMRGMNNRQAPGQGQGSASCCTGSGTQESGTSTARTDLSDKISTLQAELRSLKATQAQREGTVPADAPVAVELAKTTDAGTRP